MYGNRDRSGETVCSGKSGVPKVEISGLFCLDSDGNLKYDYAAYDALLQEWSQILIRCRMAAFRLEYPMQLNSTQKEAYQALISEHLKDWFMISVSEKA